MKKYFLKYIPVKGTIHEGDTIRDKVSGDIGTVKRWEKHINEQEDFEKVQLWLCSWDIQIGDRMYDSSRNQYGKYNGQIELWHTYLVEGKTGKEAIQSISTKDLFKVIGEISPAALEFVKEGDEFDDEQVRVMYNFVGEDSDYEFFTLEEWPKIVREHLRGSQHARSRKLLLENPFIAIKGPCNHYH
jgi:hypothetical protein